MAKQYKYRKQKKFNSKKKNARAKELTTLAFKMGQVKRGLDNPNSRISSAYNRGKTKPTKKQKKSLF